MKSDRGYTIGEQDREYVEDLAPEPAAALLAIESDAEPENIPILDRESGRVLNVLAGDRRNIVEVGTAIGYSTLWMALGQRKGGANRHDRPGSQPHGSRSNTSGVRPGSQMTRSRS